SQTAGSANEHHVVDRKVEATCGRLAHRVGFGRPLHPEDLRRVENSGRAPTRLLEIADLHIDDHAACEGLQHDAVSVVALAEALAVLLRREGCPRRDAEM